MKGEGVMNLFNVHKQRESEMERRVMMISEGVNKLQKDLLWIVHILLENPGQTLRPFVLFLSNKQTKNRIIHCGAVDTVLNHSQA